MTSPGTVRARLSGCIAPLISPFEASGTLSLEGLGAVLDFLASEGVTGVVPGDLVGEYPALSMDERQRLIEGAVTLGRGRFVVIALVSHANTETAADLARFAERSGADVIKIALPYSYVPADEMILEYVRSVTAATCLPFIVESSDELQIPVQVIDALCADPRFVGLEEMGTDLGRLYRLHRDFAGRLAFLPAGETALLVLCLLGAPGCIVAENNFAAPFMQRFLDACRRKELDLALQLFDRRTQYRDLFRAGLGRSSFTPWAKASMQLRGLAVGLPRPPHEPLFESDIARLRKALIEYFELAPVV